MGELIIQMYGAPSSDTDDVSSIDVPEDGEIMGILIDLFSPAMASADGMQAEVSFLSSSQFTTNDARGIISRCSLATNTASTSGQAGAHNSTHMMFMKGISVNAGERIHLHFETDAAVLCKIHALLVFKFKGGVRAPRRR